MSREAFIALPVVAGLIPQCELNPRFERYSSRADAVSACAGDKHLVAVVVALSTLARSSSHRSLVLAARAHGLKVGRSARVGVEFTDMIESHQCSGPCARLVALFRLPLRGESNRTHTVIHRERSEKDPAVISSSFPPTPPTPAQQASFVRAWCRATSAANVYERPCAVCARLSLIRNMSEHAENDLPLHCLTRPGELVTRAVRHDEAECVRPLSGPVLYEGGVRIEAVAVCCLYVVNVLDHCVPSISLGTPSRTVYG